jgi:hypothetical protein
MIRPSLCLVCGACCSWNAVNFSNVVKIPEPLLRIDLEETACWSFDWANSELVAIGTTHGTLFSVGKRYSLTETGTIAVYHLGQVLKDSCGLSTQL